MMAVAACQGTDDNVSDLNDKGGTDIQAYLDALPDARVIDVDSSGTPNFVTGVLGAVDVKIDARDVNLDSILKVVAPVFRANQADLVLKSTHTDNIGDQHFRFRQVKNGLDVIGGEIVVHVRHGVVYAANGSARDDLETPVKAEIDASQAVDIARADSESVLNLAASDHARLAYRLSADRMDLVYVVEVTGEQADSTPVRDDVLVNALDGSIVDRMPHIHSALNRAIYSSNNGTSTPGTLKRSEGGATTGDSAVDGNYDLLGWTYSCYKNLFGRDSYNAAGAQLKSSVHYSTNYCNAYWNSTQMVYGDGSVSQGCSNLATEIDVTAHELTHAVTENESNLTYSGESGGLNESLSDIFGAVCELYKAGGNINATAITATPSTSTTWRVGENVLPPALRYMYDPAADGSSKDYWDSSAGTVDVHYSSGISNLAFYLLSQGGTHPRGKSSVNVTGIGISKASQIFYRANRDILTASSNFAAAKTATEQAAAQLGYTTAEQASVTAAWNAVGVGVPPPPPTVLTNNVGVTGVSGSAGSQKLYTLTVPSGKTSLTFTTTGGTGDADIYVKLGSAPTTTSYTGASEGTTTAESVTITNPAAGTWYLLVYGYATYSGVTVKGAYP